MIIDARQPHGTGSIRGTVAQVLDGMGVGDNIDVTDLIQPNGRSALHKMAYAVSQYGQAAGKRFATRGATGDVCTVFRLA